MNTTINTTDTSRVLFIGDGATPQDSLHRTLSRGQHQVATSESLNDALSKLRDTTFHLVVIATTELSRGRQMAETIRAAFPWMEIIAVSPCASDKDQYEAIQSGARDYITTTCTRQELDLYLSKALEYGRMKHELTTLRQQVAMSYGFDNIVGVSRPVAKLKETIKRVAPTDITVLINGPSGSGKELLARVIHHHSPRRKNNFVTVDCSSIPESLFCAELFGEEPGSEVSSTTERNCLLKEANGGTIFFDDVDRVPPSVQPRLMDFLKNFTIRPAGQHEPFKVDVRVISASGTSIEAMVEEGCFSKELFYQLSVLPLVIPGLAQRPEDIEMLTEYFLRRQAHEMDRPLFEVTRAALDLLLSHTWSGNVRELENTLKRATALCRENTIDADDILFIGTDSDAPSPAEEMEKTALRRKTGLLDEGQRSIIIKALAENDWNFTQTAQELGIGRTTLWRKVKKYNLKRETVAQ
ncbi:MAG: sigma-54-dependent Fis family transcriptional regulator [Candidatus Zixiibacteriota bacterium]|nr:MAG: sigma-54-dependent Fis family transcriptional regulator [candidate division Zixibacteria bacterium]